MTLRRCRISTGKEMISRVDNKSMRCGNYCFVKRLIFVTPSHVLPLPFLNLTFAQKGLHSFVHSHSLFTLLHSLFKPKSTSTITLSIPILCAISGYPRTIHSLQIQQNKATFIRVDLVPPPSLQPLSQEKASRTIYPSPSIIHQTISQDKHPQPRATTSETKHLTHKDSIQDLPRANLSPSSNIHHRIAQYQ